MKNILLFIVATLSTSAFADGYIRLNALYLSEESGQGTTSKYTRTLLDLGGGYMWSSGLSLGALYGTEKRDNNGTSVNRTSFGPTIGWVSKGDGPYILATYFVSSKFDTYTGTGIEADLGYRFKVSSVELGLQFAYKKFSYNKNGSTTVNPALEQTYIDPYFIVWFEF